MIDWLSVTLSLAFVAVGFVAADCLADKPLPVEPPIEPIDYSNDIAKCEYNIRVLEKRIDYLGERYHKRVHLPTIFGVIK